mmetsp:Transcript_1647/g.3501  ORF Transcript_1647/g.3501 Transcript_1647/m.3501 type:complete len:291 (+) Transcript_1647:446-1318(+)
MESLLRDCIDFDKRSLGSLVELTQGIRVPVVVLAWISFFATFHVVALCFTLIDVGRFISAEVSSSLSVHKVCRRGMKAYSDMLPLVIFNQVFVMLPSMLIFTWLGLGFVRPEETADAHSLFWRLPLILAWMSLGHDIVFYVFHRFILHTTWGLRIFRHDIHHSTKASVALSALYMHPLDFLLEVVAPFLIPFAFVSHLSSDSFTIVLAGIGAIGGAYEHSGYNFWPQITPLDTSLHIAHHLQWNCSFSDGVGSTNVMDKLCGTAADTRLTDPLRSSPSTSPSSWNPSNTT